MRRLVYFNDVSIAIGIAVTKEQMHVDQCKLVVVSLLHTRESNLDFC